uniref:Nucleoplasmin core domain-containing protein n=1 Tax=Hucho hucho TaxID=62062 RepID=A0A4W5KPY9_9TELE
MDLSLSSSVSDTVCVLWGCELSDTQRKAAFEIAEDLLEHQFFIRTMCLSAGASKETHVVEVQDRVVEYSKIVPIANLWSVSVGLSSCRLSSSTFALGSSPSSILESM